MEVVFLILVLLVAFLYSSVGHGGASGYLALMAIFSIEPMLMKSSALVLNIVVSSIAFVSFYKGGHFKWKLLWPFAITSIPMSYLGAISHINALYYKPILAICLLCGIFRMLYKPKENFINTKEIPIGAGLSIGLVLGYISGLIGIGGGIILSPLLLIYRWANTKETAAVSAMFILLNSISGFLGLSTTSISFNSEILGMMVMAIIGGMAGSFAGSFKFQHINLKYALAMVLLIASIKLIIT